MRVAFQPIVSLASGNTLAHEALARCTLEPFRSPAVLFERAAQEQACGRLGRVVRNVLFETAPNLPVFINLHPQELEQRWLVQPTDPLYMHDEAVYLEITESAAFQHFNLCQMVLTEVRSRSNARLVVDDFGAGHSDMDRVLMLRPDFVKLDMSLIRNIDSDPERQRAVDVIVRHCTDLGCLVVAEGIETVGELLTVRDMAIGYGQGYLLGRPAFTPVAGEWPADAPKLGLASGQS